MKRYFIETSVIVAYLREKQKAIELIDKLGGELTSSYVCMAELYEGVHRVRNGEKAEKGVLDFFAGLNEIFELDKDIAKTFGEIRANLKKGGKVIEDIDILIATTCIANNLTLVTFNPKHFSRIKDLKLHSNV